MRLIIFGPQGAGKGTQSARIAEKYAIPPISTGDIFRAAKSEGSPLGQEVREYLDAGKLVPDDLTLRVVEDRLSKDDAQAGFLLDGFPRNVMQADALGKVLDKQGVALDGALVIEVPNEVSLRRLTGRRVCSGCGRNYSLDVPPREDWTCDRCGGSVVARTDDLDEDTVRRRLELYHRQTEPLKEYYAERHLLRTVDGVGTPDEVFARIVEVL